MSLVTATTSPVCNFEGYTVQVFHRIGIFQATQPGHPSVVGAMITGDIFGHWFISSVPCDQDCWHAGLKWLKTLAVNLSWRSGRHGFYASLIASNPCRLKSCKGHEPLALDFTVCVEFSPVFGTDGWVLILSVLSHLYLYGILWNISVWCGWCVAVYAGDDGDLCRAGLVWLPDRQPSANLSRW